LSYYETSSVSNTFQIEHAGPINWFLNMSANEKYVDKISTIINAGSFSRWTGRNWSKEILTPKRKNQLHYEFDEQWTAGEHKMSLEVQPLTPGVESTSGR